MQCAIIYYWTELNGPVFQGHKESRRICSITAGNGAGKALASGEAREGCRQHDKPEETEDH